MTEHARRDDGHLYPGAVADETNYAPGTIVDMGGASRSCDRCSSDHLHVLVARERGVDGSPWSRWLIGCCGCLTTRPNHPYSEDFVAPPRLRRGPERLRLAA